MLSSGLPLNVPSPKWMPSPNGVTVDSTRHGVCPPGHSELPQWMGEQLGTEPMPADMKSSTMHGIVMRSLHVEKNWRAERFAGRDGNDRKREARVSNDPSEKNELKLSSSSSSPDPSTSSSCGGASVVVVVVNSVVFDVIVPLIASLRMVALSGVEN